MGRIPDNFDFFLPIDLQKSKDDQGNMVMKISGVASTNDIDADQEMLDPNGFELDYFINNGFFNYNHQAKNDPSSLVGEPTKAWIENSKLHVEGILYPTAKGLELYELGQILDRNSTTRRLGYSIEGKVIQRDLLDPRKVLKSKITGCAITPTPKNHNTYLNIIKGEYVESDVMSSITLDDGTIITVDGDYNLKIAKSLDTGRGAPLIKESLGDKRKIDKNVEELNDQDLDKSVKQDIFIEEQAAKQLLRRCENFATAQKVIKLAQNF